MLNDKAFEVSWKGVAMAARWAWPFANLSQASRAWWESSPEQIDVPFGCNS